MKVRIYVLTILFLFAGINVEAQFFKKLKKKIEKTVEEVVIRKTGEKVTEKTDKALDGILNPNLLKRKKFDLANLPETYTFNWRYTLQLKHELGSFNQHYYLNDQEQYFEINAPVSFNNISQIDSKSLPKGFDKDWLGTLESGLMMEMQLIHKKKSKLNGTMICVALKKEPLIINTSEYKFW